MSVTLIFSPKDPAIIRKRLRSAIPRAPHNQTRLCVLEIAAGSATITLPGAQWTWPVGTLGAGSVQLPWWRFNEVLKEVEVSKAPLQVAFATSAITIGGVRCVSPDIRVYPPLKGTGARHRPVVSEMLLDSAAAAHELGMILALHLTKPAGSTPGSAEESIQLAAALRRFHLAAKHLEPLGIAGDDLIAMVVRQHLGDKPVARSFTDLPRPR